jgi:hypothetical protein
MTLEHPDWWDSNSDQPKRLSPSQKRHATFSHHLEYGKTALTGFAILPFALARLFRTAATNLRPKPADFVGLGISNDRGNPNAVVELVEELGVQRLLLRVPTWHANLLEPYLDFAQRFSNQKILINILQSRDNATDPEAWSRAVEQIINGFWSVTREFQLGNAVNRSKWGCRHTGDYLMLLDALTHLRDQFPGIVLAGSSVIDFEPLATLRTLVNFHRYRLDVCSALLYVNRRGSPFARQHGVFDLERKIRIAAALASLSNRCGKRLWITETNWPLLNTKPFTPNSGNPRSTVNESTQEKYLIDYYQTAWQTGLVERVYWWQLIQAGCGLVDHRSDKLRKMPSFYALKKLLSPNGLSNR